MKRLDAITQIRCYSIGRKIFFYGGWSSKDGEEGSSRAFLFYMAGLASSVTMENHNSANSYWDDTVSFLS